MTATLDFPGFRARNPVGWAGRRFSEVLWAIERAYERSKARDRAVDDTRVRTLFVLLAFALAFFGVAAGATHAALFAEPRASGAVLPAGHRVDMTDRNGRLLAVDLVHYGLYLDRRAIWDADETRRVLHAALPNLSSERLERALNAQGRAFLVGGLTPQQRERLDGLGLPGVQFEPEERRVYPLGASAAHVIGFADAGGRGLAGAELALDDTIRADNAAPVALSIDLRVQAALEEELRRVFVEQQARGAVGMVTDVHTGEILAMVSFPDFDPNAPGRASPDQRLNRAAQSVYEMGSVFKTFSVAAGLDAGFAGLDSRYDTNSLRIGNRSIGDYHHIGRPLTVREIFLKSSNIGTGALALSAPEGVFPAYMRRFGFLQAAPSELRESARPIVPRRWDQSTIASASFGHALSVSPLSLAQAYGAVLNGGYLRPLTIRRLPAGAPLPPAPRILSEGTSQQMIGLMRLNSVPGAGGSGSRANALGYFVGGKTGSAEKPGPGGYNRTAVVSSFAGTFPAEGPPSARRYFVFAMIDEPIGAAGSAGFRTGGLVAAPIVGRVVERIAPLLGVQRAPEAIVRQRDEAAVSVLPNRRSPAP